MQVSWTKSTQAVLGFMLVVAAGCGVPEESVDQRSSTGVKDNNESSGYDLALTTTNADDATMLIRIKRPYCRNDVASFKVDSFCVGTVVKDRYVITAAHCFLSECPLSTSKRKFVADTHGNPSTYKISDGTIHKAQITMDNLRTYPGLAPIDVKPLAGQVMDETYIPRFALIRGPGVLGGSFAQTYWATSPNAFGLDAPAFSEEKGAVYSYRDTKVRVLAGEVSSKDLDPMESIDLSEIKIAKVPTKDMTQFNWDEKSLTLSPIGVEIAPGFTSQTLKVGTSMFLTSHDMAVLDFGPDLAASYPSLTYADTKSYNASTASHYLVDFSNPASSYSKFIRARKSYTTAASIFSHKPLGGNVESLIMKASSNLVCWGDSGSPLLYANKVVGIASLGNLEAYNYSDQAATCAKMKNITYAPIKAVVVDALIAKLSASGRAPQASTVVPFDMLQIPPADGSQMIQGFPDLWDLTLHEVRANRFIATIVNPHPVTVASTWAKIPAATAGTFVPSIYAGGTLNQSAQTGNGGTTATWSASNLARGYYKVELMFPVNKNNSTCVKVKYKRTMEKSFLPYNGNSTSYVLNQTTGASTTATVYTNKTILMTPTGYEFWIETNNTNRNNGTLALQFYDSCATGKMVADSVRLTQTGTVKSTSTIPWRK